MAETTAPCLDLPTQRYQAFVDELAALLRQGYTGEVRLTVHHGLIRQYRTEQVQVPGAMLAPAKPVG